MRLLIGLTLYVITGLILFLIGRVLWFWIDHGMWWAYGLFMAGVVAFGWFGDTAENQGEVRSSVSAWRARVWRR